MIRLSSGRTALAFALAMVLAGCGDGARDSAETATGGETASQGDGLLAMDEGDESALGSIALPKPGWLPEGMPLPQDAHIYLATQIPRDGEPDLFMLQAKSLVNAGAYAKAFNDWAEVKGLAPELEDKPGVKTKLVGFTGAEGSTAMTQVISRDDYRDILITFAGPL